MSLHTDDVIQRFKTIELHDSKLESVSLYRLNRDGVPVDDIVFGLKVISGSYPMHRYTSAKLIFTGCVHFQADCDLFWKRLTSDSIDDAVCRAAPGRRDEIEGIPSRDLPDPTADCLQFSISLVHPAGGFEVVAGDFLLLRDDET